MVTAPFVGVKFSFPGNHATLSFVFQPLLCQQQQLQNYQCMRSVEATLESKSVSH